MNAFERVMAVLQGETPDCVPVCPTLLLQGAAELDMDLETYFSQGMNFAEGQLRLLDKFGHDCVFGIPHVVQDITPFGGSLMYFRNGPPSAGGMVIRDYADINQMEVPDPQSSPELVETLNALRRLREEVGGQVPILGGCIAPFSLPSMLMGAEKWMRLTILDPAEVREHIMPHLLDVALEFCVTWANLQLEAGADAVVLADGMASAAVITRQQFIDMALPVIQASIPRIDGAVIHEGVGDLYPLLDLLVGTGIVAAILTYNDDLASARETVNGDFALIGNLNNIEMRRWSVDDMAQKAGAALEQAAPGGRFILSAQGPEIPLGVSDDVIHTLVQAGHHWQY